ncbi:hypothetical protein D3G61_25630, partial [Escherichia coli]|nr:hypothetical protein [Escherichia coli]
SVFCFVMYLLKNFLMHNFFAMKHGAKNTYSVISCFIPKICKCETCQHCLLYQFLARQLRTFQNQMEF